MRNKGTSGTNYRRPERTISRERKEGEGAKLVGPHTTSQNQGGYIIKGLMVLALCANKKHLEAKADMGSLNQRLLSDNPLGNSRSP